MKRVLITGANSFLGENTKEYLEQFDEYQVTVLDMLNESWDKTSFSAYDVVLNVCAIVHRPEEKDVELYYKVNRDLAISIAKKAKNEGVKQFIQTSTNGVFGIDVGVMSIDRGFSPKTAYEKSKFEADCLLEELRSESFKVCILRPPLMYGKGCKGNFPKLERFALKFSFFPSLKNKKDFIYIENMTDFIKFAIDNDLDEICYPKDKELASVSELICLIARANGKRMHLLGVLNPFVKLFYRLSHTMRLVFGDCYYSGPTSSVAWQPRFSLEEAINKIYDK